MRLIAIDMDGTLLSPDGTISSANRLAVKRLQSRGTQIVVCTGRSFHDAALPLKRAGIVCDLICMNGAAVYGKDGMLDHCRPIARERVKRILQLAEQYDLITDLMSGEYSCTTVSWQRFKEGFEEGILLPMVDLDFEGIQQRFIFTDRDKVIGGEKEIFKISVMHRNEKILGEVREILEGEGGLALASSDRTNIEITSRLAQKGLALMEYARARQIPKEEIMAIGDSGNDVSMLSLPLGATVAMGNAMPEARRAAMYETKTNDEDGVAWAIETWAEKKWETA